MLRGQLIATLGRSRKRGKPISFGSLDAIAHLYGDIGGKADIARKRIGAEGIDLDQGIFLIVRTRLVLLIELCADLRLIFDVIGSDKLLMQLLLLGGKFIG